MTVIKIEKKKPVWPLILGIGVVAVLIYFFAFNEKEETVQEVQFTEDLINVTEFNRTVAAYVSFINEDTLKMEFNDSFSKEAFLKLVDATNAMAEEINMDIHSNMARVVKYVNRIKADPIETAHADDFRKAADLLTSSVLKSMQQSKYPDLASDIVELENASASIDPNILILDQIYQIKTFFREASDLLLKMN
ncbi:MAG: hypothetical protein Q8R96_23000 [Bacteroidota bacterium]|nr:hypothetical protein [Bacteroidota bacterium]